MQEFALLDAISTVALKVFSLLFSCVCSCLLSFHARTKFDVIARTRYTSVCALIVSVLAQMADVGMVKSFGALLALLALAAAQHSNDQLLEFVERATPCTLRVTAHTA